MTKPGVLILIAFLISVIFLPLKGVIFDLFVLGNLYTSICLLIYSSGVDRAASYKMPKLFLLVVFSKLVLVISAFKVIITSHNSTVLNFLGYDLFAGNLSLALGIFLFIFVANLLVLAKGATRLAEVLARFALDTLPNKQMSIEGDYRNFNLVKVNAEKEKKKIGDDSEFYAGMDGAIRFVQGDTLIPVISILLISLVAGALSFDQGWEYFLKNYGKEILGFGILLSLTTLLTSTSAILVLDQVKESKNNLSRSLFISSVIFLIIAVLPASPSLTFVIPALFGIVLGATLWDGEIWSRFNFEREYYFHEYNQILGEYGISASIKEYFLKNSLEIAKNKSLLIPLSPKIKFSNSSPIISKSFSKGELREDNDPLYGFNGSWILDGKVGISREKFLARHVFSEKVKNINQDLTSEEIWSWFEELLGNLSARELIAKQGVSQVALSGIIRELINDRLPLVKEGELSSVIDGLILAQPEKIEISEIYQKIRRTIVNRLLKNFDFNLPYITFSSDTEEIIEDSVIGESIFDSEFLPNPELKLILDNFINDSLKQILERGEKPLFILTSRKLRRALERYLRGAINWPMAIYVVSRDELDNKINLNKIAFI